MPKEALTGLFFSSYTLFFLELAPFIIIIIIIIIIFALWYLYYYAYYYAIMQNFNTEQKYM